MSPESIHVKHWKEECTYLITIPRYYFKNKIEFWNISPVGQYISDVLNDSPEHKLGVYIFETENGDAHENVSEIFEFMLQNEGNMCTIYTFTQCSSCNRIGTVNEKFHASILLWKKNANIVLTVQKMMLLLHVNPK